MKPLCPKCRTSQQMKTIQSTLSYICEKCLTEYNGNYLAGWNDCHHALTNESELSVCQEIGRILSSRVKSLTSKIDFLRNEIESVLGNLEINYDIDGNSMKDSDTANKLRKVLLSTTVNAPFLPAGSTNTNQRCGG